MSSPQTILYLTPSSRLLGARRSLLQLVTNLDPARYRPVVVAQRPGDLVDALRDAGVPVHLLFLGWWRKAIYWPLLPLRIPQLARLARKEDARLLHCNEFHSNPHAVLAARLAGGLPVVTHMRLSITPRQVDKYLLRRATRVLAVSQAAARDFDVWPDRRERVEVVYNGVDLEEFRSSLSREEARERLGLGAEDFVVAQFGLLSPRKQQHLLLRAARIVTQKAPQAPQVRFLIVGSPGRTELYYEQELRAMAMAMKLNDVVQFIPFTPAVTDIYRACDLNVLVSNDEGFGRTIIEAGAFGIPSIGTATGGIPELIEEGATGALVAADDDGSDLAARILQIAGNTALCRAWGEAARKQAENRFSIARHVEQVMAIYDRVLGER